MKSHSEAVQGLFNAHQTRLAAIAAVPGVAALSESLRVASAASLSKEIQALLRSQYTSDCAAGKTAEEKLAILATSVAKLAKQMRPLAPNDSFYQAFTTGSVSAAQEVFVSIFAPPSKEEMRPMISRTAQKPVPPSKNDSCQRRSSK
jgi:hypothetical protein